jgi:hypothetical protein
MSMLILGAFMGIVAGKILYSLWQAWGDRPVEVKDGRGFIHIVRRRDYP